ncbi:phage tail protein I [Ruegeria halocynthiae]|uniref:phage tail protein I n=1 Tax=Ruegeria halocynthiae TaxID=985054 RepID=UPI00136401E4|nr:phage tail protein I [Ruegeria halocynthiae]
MSAYWPRSKLDRITPPQVLDERGSAYLQALNEIIGDQPITAFQVKDAETCPAEALPALIAEYSMEEFIDPDLPEAIQRRILKNAWLLQKLEGYDAGVKLGLSLLGMTAIIEQWHAQVPMGVANTHRITVEIDELLYPDEGGHFSDRQVAAIWRMINATKRHSQGTELRTAVAARGKAYVGVYMGAVIKATAPAVVPPPPVITIPVRRVFVPTVTIFATAGTPS